MPKVPIQQAELERGVSQREYHYLNSPIDDATAEFLCAESLDREQVQEFLNTPDTILDLMQICSTRPGLALNTLILNNEEQYSTETPEILRNWNADTHLVCSDQAILESSLETGRFGTGADYKFAAKRGLVVPVTGVNILSPDKKLFHNRTTYHLRDDINGRLLAAAIIVGLADPSSDFWTIFPKFTSKSHEKDSVTTKNRVAILKIIQDTQENGVYIRLRELGDILFDDYRSFEHLFVSILYPLLDAELISRVGQMYSLSEKGRSFNFETDMETPFTKRSFYWEESQRKRVFDLVQAELTERQLGYTQLIEFVANIKEVFSRTSDILQARRDANQIVDRFRELGLFTINDVEDPYGVYGDFGQSPRLYITERGQNVLRQITQFVIDPLTFLEIGTLEDLSSYTDERIKSDKVERRDITDFPESYKQSLANLARRVLKIRGN